jgi:hypothetical protein
MNLHKRNYTRRDLLPRIAHPRFCSNDLSLQFNFHELTFFSPQLALNSGTSKEGDIKDKSNHTENAIKVAMFWAILGVLSFLCIAKFLLLANNIKSSQKTGY